MNYIHEIVQSKVPDLVEIPPHMGCGPIEYLGISFQGFQPLEFHVKNENLNLIIEMCCD